jgi:hypothetical protein
MLRVFENRVLRKLFGPKSDEVTGGGGEKVSSLKSPSLVINSKVLFYRCKVFLQ